ncbi:DNA-binding protein [Roseateles sp. MS654]|uniref:DNA-binding protein n=1 Tax=Roseateles sp. MS654 TaxID=3412685 RepID=UPI003C30CD12
MEHKQPNVPSAELLVDRASPETTRAVKLKSPEEAQQWFAERGITISEWALERQFNPALVYQVLAGTRKAVRGTSFKIAVALGIKTLPTDGTVTTA